MIRRPVSQTVWRCACSCTACYRALTGTHVVCWCGHRVGSRPRRLSLLMWRLWDPGPKYSLGCWRGEPLFRFLLCTKDLHTDKWDFPLRKNRMSRSLHLVEVCFTSVVSELRCCVVCAQVDVEWWSPGHYAREWNSVLGTGKPRAPVTLYSPPYMWRRCWPAR